MSKKLRIVWAIDPLERNNDLKNHALSLLKTFEKRASVSILPTYILSDGMLGLSVPPNTLDKQLRPAAERALTNFLKTAGLKSVESPKILICAPSSVGTAAHALDQFARKNKADFILVSSHGRSGLNRLLLGSFAETLVLRSTCPVIITGPRTSKGPHIKNLVFPTDFSAKSKKSFPDALKLAKELKAHIVIYHAVVNPMDPIVQTGAAMIGGGFVSTKSFTDESGVSQRKKADVFVKMAKAQKVKAEVKIEFNSPSAALGVSTFAKKTAAGMIIMASESGIASAALLGSIGREVARTAPCPVLFIRKR